MLYQSRYHTLRYISNIDVSSHWEPQQRKKLLPSEKGMGQFVWILSPMCRLIGQFHATWHYRPPEVFVSVHSNPWCPFLCFIAEYMCVCFFVLCCFLFMFYSVHIQLFRYVYSLWRVNMTFTVDMLQHKKNENSFPGIGKFHVKMRGAPVWTPSRWLDGRPTGIFRITWNNFGVLIANRVFEINQSTCA